MIIITRILFLILIILFWIPIFYSFINELRRKSSRVGKSNFFLILDYFIQYFLPLTCLILIILATTFNLKILEIIGIQYNLLIAIMLYSIILVIFKSTNKNITHTQIYSNVEESKYDIKNAILNRMFFRKEANVFVIAGGGEATAIRIKSLMADKVAQKLTKKINLKVLLLNPDSVDSTEEYKSLLETAQRTIQEYKKIKEDLLTSHNKITLDYRTYSYVPVIHGTYVEDEALFMGIYHWKTPEDEPKSAYPDLISSEKPFIYYKKDDELYTIMVCAFENWFEKLWSIGKC